jgi:hypothetical protein
MIKLVNLADMALKAAANGADDHEPVLPDVRTR